MSESELALELINMGLMIDERFLIEDISLTVKRGQCLAVTGLAGSGKSSLLNLISTLVPPSVGSLRLFGQDTNLIGEEGRRLLRLMIGMVFEEGALLDGFTVGDNVELPLARIGIRPPKLTQRADEWLNQCQLMAYRNFMPYQLSMRLTRKVALARALVIEPQLLICDEVTTGLDLQTVLSLNQLLKLLRLRHNTTIVIATSDLAEIVRIADMIAVLNEGRLAFYGNLQQLTEQRHHQPLLREVFNEESWLSVFHG